MAQLVDTFSSDLLAPFKSTFSILNNFSSFKLNRVDYDSDSLPEFKYKTIITHPTAVKDFYFSVEYKTLIDGGDLNHIFFTNQCEYDPFGNWFGNLQIKLNNTSIVTNHGYTNGLNRIFYKVTDFLQKSTLGGSCINYSMANWSSNLATARQQLTNDYLHLKPNPGNNIRAIVPLGVLSDFFNQSTVLPDNTLLEISFTPYRIQTLFTGSIAFPDNFVRNASTALSYTSSYIELPTLALYYPTKLVAPEVRPYAETIFKSVWREWKPIYTSTPFSIPQVQKPGPFYKQKFSTQVDYFPEIIALWINCGAFVNYPHLDFNLEFEFLDYTTFQLGTVQYTVDSAKKANMITPDGDEARIQNLRISINGTAILTYDYDKVKLDFATWIAAEETIVRNEIVLPNSPYRRAPYFISLTRVALDKTTYSKLSGGLFTLEITLARNIETQSHQTNWLGPTKEINLNVWGTNRRALSIDSWRRTTSSLF